MSLTLKQIEDEALRLSQHDRAELIRFLVGAMDPGVDEGVREAWAEEAQRRYEAYAAERSSARPATEAMAEARRKLKR